MTNPWNTFDAFKPMFIDTIGYKTKTFSTSLKCALFPLVNIEPFVDVDAETEIMKLNVLIDYDDWRDSTKPQIGDTIQLEDGTYYKVAKVVETQNWFDITARSI